MLISGAGNDGKRSRRARAWAAAGALFVFSLLLSAAIVARCALARQPIQVGDHYLFGPGCRAAVAKGEEFAHRASHSQDDWCWTTGGVFFRGTVEGRFGSFTVARVRTYFVFSGASV